MGPGMSVTGKHSFGFWIFVRFICTAICFCPMGPFGDNGVFWLTRHPYRVLFNDLFILQLQSMPYCLQRSPEYFDDPLKFDPNRFGPGQKRYSCYVHVVFNM